MQFFINTVAGIAGLALLYFGAGWLVHGGSAIARKMKVPPLVIGLTLVACGTSMPELVVSVDAALTGHGDVSIGNVIGSNIANIALILGICAMIAPLPVNARLFKWDVPVLVLSTVVLAFFHWYSGGLTTWQGGILLLGMIAYTLWNLYASRQEEKKQQLTGTPREYNDKLPLALLQFAGGLGALVVGGKILVWSAVYIAGVCRIPEAVIGLTVVAVGTSMPELATSVVAAQKGEKDIAVGNVIGSNIFNILGIMGLAALLEPIHAPGIGRGDLGILIFLTAALIPIIKTGHKITRQEGIFLLAIYGLYLLLMIWS